MRTTTELVKLFKANGFTLVRVTKHMIWRCPCGHIQITCSVTPSKGNRSTDNTRADIARAVRACKPNNQRSAA